ncbi:hypothetical protein O6H91_04G095000 [Diphasiastrum complanatum]|uniref:Uncharacterized protein n=1 Tax=Diphasiastrum complanatum TaxID=34168 RepID=A0ACC2DZ85_DIPCM|nr:hypothetical protein O6H91_04G095000 [Diphasiastrum complanatum]
MIDAINRLCYLLFLCSTLLACSRESEKEIMSGIMWSTKGLGNGLTCLSSYLHEISFQILHEWMIKSRLGIPFSSPQLFLALSLMGILMPSNFLIKNVIHHNLRCRTIWIID